MKVVIDTNVVVSAALKDRAPEEVLRFVVAQPEWEWVVSAAILAEYKSVLARAKFGLPADLRQQWSAFLDAATILVEVHLDIPFPQDPTDAKFLACALTANAAYLITGDHDFTEARKLLSTTILSVSQFKRLIADPAR